MGILVTNGCSFTYGDELPGTRNGFDENGVYLPDKHHHHTFTYKLSEKLGVNYINLAANGSSNQKIFRKTMRFIQNTSKVIDYMVIVWSSWGRLEVCSPQQPPPDKKLYIEFENNMIPIIPNHHSGKLQFILQHWQSFDNSEIVLQAAKDWYEHVYSMQTPIVHHLNYMRTVQHICDLMGIKLIQGVIHHGMRSDFISTIKYANKVSPNMKDYLNFVQESMFFLRPECKLGLADDRDMVSISEKNGLSLYPIGHPCENTHTYYADMLYKIFEEMKSVSD